MFNSSKNISWRRMEFPLVGIFLTLISCQFSTPPLFRMIPPDQSGITFSNDIQETEDFNILNFHYIYNGGGVGVADLDKNGLPDLIFSGNQVPSAMYLNEGNLAFKEISNAAQFSSSGWNTGISIVDINADSWPDIYLSVGGLDCTDNCKNKLFIHQGVNKAGIPQFEEMAAQYGLEDGAYTQQAIFFDCDRDGDLDVYLLHNAIDNRDKNAPSDKKFINKTAQDRLLINDGIDENNAVRFSEHSADLGIIHRGYGLGVTIEDFNQDGWPDIYVANDFLSDDLMYLNLGNQDGNFQGFQNTSDQYLKHTSYNSMGVDVADLNNDGLSEILVLDMMPEYHERQKTTQGFMNYNKFLMTLRQGYSAQFIRNTLQQHNGQLNGAMLPFSEIGYSTGLYNTDWSWTPLLADFDNDGDRDVFITNGYGKDITELDFINYSNQAFTFGTPATRKTALFNLVQQMESIKLPNYIFENEGKFSFENQSKNWLQSSNSISNGASYADLDLDGDLDLIVNNINEPAYLLENTLPSAPANNFLTFTLKGPKHNPSAIGTQIHIWHNGQMQYHYQSPVRGYLSSVEEAVHFGLGKNTAIDSMRVTWPDGQYQEYGKRSGNRVIKLDYNNGPNTRTPKRQKNQSALFQSADFATQIIPKENIFQDFDRQPLLLHQHSRQGPCLAVLSSEQTATQTFYLGGAKGVAGQLITFDETGILQQQSFPDQLSEDTDALFFDADGDGDEDLYVVSGGSDFPAAAAAFQDRLYLNNGNQHFKISSGKLPLINSSGSCIAPCDFDQDGDIDLFIGGRIIPGKYPTIPESILLKNDNGQFINVTDELPTLKKAGMITDAVWADYNQDGWEDLIIVGEWMPVTIFQNSVAGLKEQPIEIKNTAGLWNCLASADLNEDGRVDFILGNLGLNSRLKASATEPLALYKKDFDNNGSPDPLVAQYYQNKSGGKKSYPLHSRDDVVKQLASIKNRYVKYEEFAQASFPEIMQTTHGAADQLIANELRSMTLLNRGDGTFDIVALPREVQQAPIQDILIKDFDRDGHLDALMSGNDYTAEKNGGWHDAFNGALLKGNGAGQFTFLAPQQSGILIAGDGRDLISFVSKDGRRWIIAAQNQGTLQFYHDNKPLLN